MFLHVGTYIQVHKMLQPRRPTSTMVTFLYFVTNRYTCSLHGSFSQLQSFFVNYVSHLTIGVSM
jgi:hypothetical protein